MKNQKSKEKAYKIAEKIIDPCSKYDKIIFKGFLFAIAWVVIIFIVSLIN